ncbi:tetratricopeptide repeat protein [Oricola nitratireducens]|uniref:tetratricopeptide repeat protein n=1 Tax=Oricola nitratireducens TaxID=2775868 RepID=UPI00186874C8|nr:hypothetical protein [Oricola nitratireducens]
MGDASGRKRIDPADIKIALNDILQSETFARSERSRELLKYIVERDLDGEADRLKGFAIALDVFDREDNFDPSTDAVVRVQAGRLRDLLDTYYAGEGSGVAVRITIPRGTYVPVYDAVVQAPAPDAGADAGVPEFPAGSGVGGSAGPPGKQAGAAEQMAPSADQILTNRDFDRMFYVNMRLFWSALTVVVIMLTGILVLLINNSVADNQLKVEQQALAAMLKARGFSASEALPSVALSSDVKGGMRTAFEDAIPRFGSVVYRNDAAVTLDHPLADFFIHAVQSGKNSFNIQLYHRASGILIGTDQIPAYLSGRRLDDNVARIMSRFLPVGGSIYAFLESDNRLNPLTRCLVLASAYFNDQNAERHHAAYRCHESLIEAGITSALSYADLASLTVETVTDKYDYPLDAKLSDAVVRARRAVELAPNSALTHRALGRALLVSGERRAALDQMREAFSLNRYDLGIAASYGNTLVAVGDFEPALGVLERAAKAAPVHPTWWDYGLFVAAFQTGRNDLVAVSSRNLVGHDRAHYCAARLIAAYLEGNKELQLRMLSDMQSRDNVFVRDPLAFYEKIMPRAAAQKLVSALSEAGMKVPSVHEG